MPVTPNAVQVCEYFLKPGYLLVNPEDTLVRAVLGNCVAVTIFDRHNRFGGINHFVFPSTGDRAKATAQFGNVAIAALYRMLKDLGARPRSLVAQILGGAIPDQLHDESLGQQNVDLARKMLKKFDIPIISEDTGGYLGRKILYHTGTNEVVTIKGQTIRREDWFLPGEDLRFRTNVSEHF